MNEMRYGWEKGKTNCENEGTIKKLKDTYVFCAQICIAVCKNKYVSIKVSLAKITYAYYV